MLKELFLLCQITLFNVGYLWLINNKAIAQVTPDGTLETQVNQNSNSAEITGGQTRGGNLFHSFQDFSVQTGNEAFFNNADRISNIFSRVTGGNLSNIDGLIRSNSSANLFLINPAGIILGENARLNVGGSFYGSSASSILFEDGDEFSAVDGLNEPILTIKAPIGLGLDNPADITVRGDGLGTRLSGSEPVDTQDALRVGGNATIGIVGGNLIFESATIKTAGGRIELGSVAQGIVDLVEVANGFTFDYSRVEAFGDISLSGNSSAIDASGNAGGDINVAGNNVSLSDSSAIAANTLGDGAGGAINIFATESINLSGVENENNFISAISNRVFANATGDAGDINIETGSLNIGDRAIITTSSSGQGNAGNITINATDSVSLASQGNTSAISSPVSSNGTGNGGNITIDAANSVRLQGGTNRAVISSENANADSDRNAGNIAITTNSLDADNGRLFTQHLGTGNAGNITIVASENIALNNNSTINVAGTDGSAGNIDITSGSLTAENSQIALSAFSLGLGTGGNITIDAVNEVSFSNSSSMLVTGSPGGSLNIDAKSLSLVSGSLLTAGAGIDSEVSDLASGDIVIDLSEDLVLNGANSENPTTINNSNFGLGNSGNIEVNARNITFSNGGRINSFTVSQGNVGNITLNALGDVSLDGINGVFRSTVSNFVDENGTGNAGDFNLTAQNLSLTNGANIGSLVSGTGNAGDLNLNVADTITVDGLDTVQTPEFSGNLPSQILSRVASTGIGNSGNINITAQNLLLFRSGNIDTSIRGRGNAGNINIKVSDTFAALGGLITSNIGNSSGIGAIGKVGSININAREINFSDTAQIQAGLFSGATGEPGTVSLNATESISFTGDKTGIFSDSDPGSVGNAGETQLSAPNIFLDHNVVIQASNRGEGNGGNIIINADNLNLERSNFINASTSSGVGGNVTLQIADKIILRSNNEISARASEDANGGNINIDTNSIVAFPNGNNDIIANAEQGNGGNININAESLFGIENRPLNSLTNDINASSEFSIDGQVEINTPDVDPARGITGLPTEVVDASKSIIRTCLGGGEVQKSNRFVVTGRGGMPNNPNESLSDDATLAAEWVSLPKADMSEQSSTLDRVTYENADNTIVEAKGWKVNSQGKIILTAEANSFQSAVPWLDNYKCDRG